MTFTDAGIDPNKLTCPRASERGDRMEWRLLGIGETWGERHRNPRKTCPVCRSEPKGWSYCLCCDRTGRDGVELFPGRIITEGLRDV